MNFTFLQIKLRGTATAASVNGRSTTTIPTLDLSKMNEPLQTPKQIISDGSGIVRATLHYDVVKYIGPSFTTYLKLYNGGLGPTIRVKPGDSLILELFKDLQGPPGNEVPNQFSHPNSTNIHLHGPHLSGELPGDSVFVRIDPQEKFTYHYVIGSDHMPGTKWYHPHLHGST